MTKSFVKGLSLKRLIILVATVASLCLSASFAFGAESIAITGSVQFWKRICDASYQCNLPTPISEKLPIDAVLYPPTPDVSLSFKTVRFDQDGVNGELSVYWKKTASESYLAGQSFLAKDGVRIAECSQYASDDVARFLPVGFCSGYTTEDGSTVQYGMTFYK